MKCGKCGRPCYGTDFHEIDEKGNTIQILCKHCFHKLANGEKTKEKEIDFNMRSGRHCHSLSLANNREK